MALVPKCTLLLMLLALSFDLSTPFDFNKLVNGLNIPGLNSTLIPGLINNGLKAIQKLLGKTFNFDQIARGAKILLGNKQLNSRDFRLVFSEANKLLKYLHGFTLDDRMKVWGLMVEYGRLFEGSLAHWDVEKLHLFENDIALSLKDVEDLIDGVKNSRTPVKRSAANLNHRIKRKIVADIKGKWDRVIPYRFEDKYAPNEKALIRSAMKHWEDETCLSFVEKTSNIVEDHIVFIRDNNLCYSLVGRANIGPQPISIDTGCFNFGIIVHEVGHALGMWHEQSRPDRDLYVDVVQSNVESGRLKEFQIRSWQNTISNGIPYDYGSVMHYGRKDFSSSSRDTLKSKSFGYQQTIGQLRRASFHDVKIINSLYCRDLCGSRNLDWSKCEADGYRNPLDCNRCKCPEGLKEPFCQEVADQSIPQCGSKELQAGSSWTELTSPGYPARILGPATCYWRIKAPAGLNVRLEFLDPFSLPQPPHDACTSYIEVRYKELSLTGPRFCGVNRPFDPIISEDESAVLLLYRASSANWRPGFKVRFRAERCNDCGPGSPNVMPACVATHRYICYGNYKCNWLGRTKCKRFNTCYKTTYTCCPGYNLSGKTCTKI